MNGQFVISLDFEKYWGVFDSIAANGNYTENLNNVDVVIDRLLALSKCYNIKLTFSTVGFLFNKSKAEFIENTPDALPNYAIKTQNPYPLINDVDANEGANNQHYGYNSLIKINKEGQHEIGTHTYSHYYCLEEGQSIEQFTADLKMALKVANDFNIELQSIVFPRNQINKEYLQTCFDNGIISYRGIENHAIYKPNAKKKTTKPIWRALRLIDAYINVTGKHTYKFEHLKSNGIINLPSSRFLRSYSKSLKSLEPLKLRRIKKAMLKAAKKKELFHLWWHPHNFGNHIDENFKNLESIFKTYQLLNKSHGFSNSTMTELALKLKSEEIK